MQKYNALCKPNQLIYGSGQIAVITGWTSKDVVRKYLSSDVYAVIGELYSSSRGLSFLIRNLLNNPHVRFMVALNATKQDKNAGACQCLKDFFDYGFEEGISDSGRKCWVVKSNVAGYIDIEIDSESLENLRKFIEFIEVKSIDALALQVQAYSEKGIVQPWGNPLEFPLPIIESVVFPGNIYGHRIEGKTIAETWVKIIHRIKTTGIIRPTNYDGKWQELINVMSIVTDEPDYFYFPEPNFLPISRDFLQEYISQILDDVVFRPEVKYTYGQRLRSWFQRDQIKQVVEKLIQEIDAASAVMNLWDVKDHDRGGSPCLNHIWVRVVDGQLSLTATFRSNDMFSAWPANAMGLLALQKYIIAEINSQSNHALRRGPLITNSQSAHIYDDTWGSAEHLIQTQYADICKKRNFSDPIGNFLVEIVNQEILVTRTTPKGEAVECRQGSNPLKLLREICSASPSIIPEHAGYLGMELQKASDCLKNNLFYSQG